MKAVFKLNVDCGRIGELEGLFIATKQEVKQLLECPYEVYFGEVLGKHSEVYGKIEEKEIIFVSDDENVIKIIEEHDLSGGFDPFDYEFLNFDYENVLPDNEDATTVREVLAAIRNKS